MDRMSYKDFYEVTGYSPEDGTDRHSYYRHDQFFNVRHFAEKGGGKGRVILDVGCGNGYKTGVLAGDNTVYGLDITEANIEKAAEKGIKAQLHDVEDPIPFEDNCFDLVVCSEVLEHLFLPEKVLKEIHRVLKKGGIFIATVPNLYCFRNRFTMLIGADCIFLEYPENRYHIRHYSLHGMSNLLKKSGFRIKHVRGQEFAMNFDWPFKLIWYLHGGNKGLKLLIRIVTFGRKTEVPGLVLQFHIIRFLGWLFPRWSVGLLFECEKL